MHTGACLVVLPQKGAKGVHHEIEHELWRVLCLNNLTEGEVNPEFLAVVYQLRGSGQLFCG